jgi:hypothetical protein
MRLNVILDRASIGYVFVGIILKIYRIYELILLII